MLRCRPTVALFGDSELVINWVTGKASCHSASCTDFVKRAHVTCYRWWADSCAAPTEMSMDWYGHVYREHNTEADYLAGRGAAGANRGYTCKNIDMSRPIVSLQGFFDGSGGKDFRDEAPPQAGAGWKLFCWQQGAESWQQIARACVCLGNVGSTMAELTAMHQITLASDQLLRTGRIEWSQPGWIGDMPKPCDEGADSRGVKRDRT